MLRWLGQIVQFLLVALLVGALPGCTAERMMGRAGGAVEAFATKGLDKIDPESIFAHAMIDATNPETEGAAEVYQAWGVRWRNRYNGIIARGHVQMAGQGGVGDDPQLRELIREKFGDPLLKALDQVVEDYQKLQAERGNPPNADGFYPAEAAPLPRSAAPGAP